MNGKSRPIENYSTLKILRPILINIAATHGKLMFASGPITNIGYQGNLKCSNSVYLIASAR